MCFRRVATSGLPLFWFLWWCFQIFVLCRHLLDKVEFAHIYAREEDAICFHALVNVSILGSFASMISVRSVKIKSKDTFRCLLWFRWTPSFTYLYIKYPKTFDTDKNWEASWWCLTEIKHFHSYNLKIHIFKDSIHKNSILSNSEPDISTSAALGPLLFLSMFWRVLPRGLHMF